MTTCPITLREDMLQRELMNFTALIKKGEAHDKTRFKTVVRELRELGFPI